METITFIQICWIAFICATWLIVMEMVYLMLTDDEVKQAAQVILNHSDTSRQFELFIKTINAGVTETVSTSEQLRATAHSLGMTEREFLWRLGKRPDERKTEQTSESGGL